MGAEPVFEGYWMSELALWVHWIYRGHLCAVSMSSIIAIGLDMFQELMTRQEGIGFEMMRRYAISLMAVAQDQQDSGMLLTDMPFDEAKTDSLALRAAKMSTLQLQGWQGLFGR